MPIAVPNQRGILTLNEAGVSNEILTDKRIAILMSDFFIIPQPHKWSQPSFWLNALGDVPNQRRNAL